jgi:Tfp pilus assembly protein PilV
LIEALVAVVVVGFILALAGGLLYYKSNAESSERDEAETRVAQEVAETRAGQAEDEAARRAAERYEEAKKRAENATLDSAVRDWLAAGRLWDKDRGGGKAGGSGTVPGRNAP